MVLVTAVPRPWLGLQVNNEIIAIKAGGSESMYALKKRLGLKCMFIAQFFNAS